MDHADRRPPHVGAANSTNTGARRFGSGCRGGTDSRNSIQGRLSMRKSIITGALLVGVATAVHAQGRGGRGAGPDWARPHGTMCIDMDSVLKVEVVKGPAAASAYGADAAAGIVIIYTKPGPGLRNCTVPSSGGDDALGKLFLPPDLVMSHQQAINLTEQQRALIQSNMMDTQKT